MKSAVQAGLILGITVVVWTALHAALGWYKDPGMSWTFWMVIPFELILVVFMLKNTKKQGFGYGKQVMAGIVMSLVAAAIVFVGSYLIVPAVFPTYFQDLRAMSEKVWTAQGLPPDQVQARLAKEASMYTAMGSATLGFIGTLCTGLIVSLIASGLIRSKGSMATA